MTAIGVTTIVWMLAGRWRILFAQFCIVSAAALLSVVAIKATGRDLQTSAPYSMYEHAVSIFDPTGAGSYINGDSGNPGDNNRFRLVWWRDVINQTLTEGPIFGLGFGADLSTQFLADYDLLGDESFAARSPHSMIVTVFGRMGALGLALWLLVSAALARMIWRLVRKGDADGRGLACVVCVVWVSACFGVVLEGPMGAVIFWVAVGLANAKVLEAAIPGVSGPVAEPQANPQIDWHVAKAGAFVTQTGIR
jgi:O-antigen ligase